jgi:hypothetical protein
MAQVVCRRLVTAEGRPWLNSGLILLGLVVGEVALGQDFIRVLRIFLVTLFLPILHSDPLVWHRCYKCNLSY